MFEGCVLVSPWTDIIVYFAAEGMSSKLVRDTLSGFCHPFQNSDRSQNRGDASGELFLDIFTKEEREALLTKKMEEIRKKNKQLQKRHAVSIQPSLLDWSKLIREL